MSWKKCWCGHSRTVCFLKLFSLVVRRANFWGLLVEDGQHFKRNDFSTPLERGNIVWSRVVLCFVFLSGQLVSCFVSRLVWNNEKYIETMPHRVCHRVVLEPPLSAFEFGVQRELSSSLGRLPTWSSVHVSARFCLRYLVVSSKLLHSQSLPWLSSHFLALTILWLLQQTNLLGRVRASSTQERRSWKFISRFHPIVFNQHLLFELWFVLWRNEWSSLDGYIFLSHFIWPLKYTLDLGVEVHRPVLAWGPRLILHVFRSVCACTVRKCQQWFMRGSMPYTDGMKPCAQAATLVLKHVATGMYLFVSARHLHASSYNGSSICVCILSSTYLPTK